jgi:hypothetical protein
VHAQAHRPVEGALEQLEPPVRGEAEEEQPAAPVAGEGERQALLGEPGREPGGDQELEPRPRPFGSRRLAAHGA